MIAARLHRPATAPLLIAAVVFAAVLPPAHIHLAAHDDHDHDHDHDHATAVEHSHWSAHQSSRAAFDDDDGHLIFVNRPARSADAQTTVARPPAVLAALIALPPAITFDAAERPTSGNSPRDGPARADRPLRAPPSFVTL